MSLNAQQRARAYQIIGRTDRAFGEPGLLDLPEDLSVAICQRFRWPRFERKPVRLYRGGQLEVQGEGGWLEGWARISLYELLGIPPWTTGDAPPAEDGP